MNIYNDFKLLDFINLDEMMWAPAGVQTLAIDATASLVLTAHAPSYVTLGVAIPKASLTIAAHAPTVHNVGVYIPAAVMTLTANAPSYFQGFITEVPTGSLKLSGYPPVNVSGTPQIPLASITLTAYAPACGVSQVYVPQASLVLTAYSPVSLVTVVSCLANTGSIALTAYPPGFGPAAIIIPKASSLELAAYSPTQSWSLGVNALYKKQTIFQCILTGAADGLTDLVIPISSFQSTVRDGDPTYLACVIPNSINYIADISARTNGDIVIKQGYKLYDGSIQAEEIIRVDYENLQDARGGRSASATISGHKTTNSSSPKSIELEEVTYYGLQANGKRTFRAKPDIFLRVGDTAVYGTESIIIGQISYTVDTRQAIMQVTEA